MRKLSLGAYLPVSATQLQCQRLEQGIKGTRKLTFPGDHETSATANSVGQMRHGQDLPSFKSPKEAWLPNYAPVAVPSSNPHQTSALGKLSPLTRLVGEFLRNPQMWGVLRSWRALAPSAEVLRLKKGGPAPSRPLCPRGSQSDRFVGPLQVSASF